MLKTIKKNKIILLLIIIVSAEVLLLSSSNIFAADDKTVNIVFTHDLHSYIEGYDVVIDGETKSVGGMGRLSTFIEDKRDKFGDILLLDGGDLSVGTLYQTLYAKEAIELRILGLLGYDATTFGNHDFDFSNDELISMFNTAAAKSDYLPSLCVSNFEWNLDDEATLELYNAASKCNLCRYDVFEKNGVRIAVFGIFGQEAAKDSPTLKLDVLDQIESARSVVEEIKNNEDVDMIVCLSHSGTKSDLEESEDVILAKAVPEIDVIVSAHSHTLLEEPVVVNDTYVVSCGCYGQYTGYCALSQRADGRWLLDEYVTVLMNDTIPSDEVFEEFVHSFDDEISSEYLSEFNLTKGQVIATNSITFESVNDMYYVHTEHKLGNLLSDSYRYAASNVLATKGYNVDIAVVPAGTVRGTFLPGDISCDKAFEAYSLGTGSDGLTGYPLVRFYLTGKEVKLIAEIDASLSGLMHTARLYCSGLEYKIGTHRMLLNKAYDIRLVPDALSDNTVDIDDKKLYCIVTDMYTVMMIGSVSDVSHGLIKIEPKLEDGTVLEKIDDAYNYESIVIYDDDGNQLKAWVAINDYLSSFEKDDRGISVIPEYYNDYHGRKVIDDSMSPSHILCQTNRYFWIILIGGGCLIAFVGFAVSRIWHIIIKARKRIRK